MIKEKVLITGFNGQLSKVLATHIDTSKYELYYLTSNKNISDSKSIFYWNINSNYIEKKALINTQHIVHLAGLSISKRWNKKNKQIMYKSRVNSATLLYKKCKQFKIYPKTFITASAMGYYGYGKGLKEEDDAPGNDWLSKMCVDWEQAADNFKNHKTRVIKLRLSLLINKKSGILQQLLIGFKFLTAIVFGSGEQKISWIHIIDAAKFINFILNKNRIQGTFNVANENHITLIKLIQVIRQSINRYSLLIYIPEKITRLILQGKSNLIFNDIIVCTKKIKKTGFKYKYPRIEDAIKKELN